MKLSQCEQIAEILRKEGRIDNFRAIQEKITLRLGARIFDLGKLGWKFRKYFANPERTNYVYEVVHEPDERESDSEAEQAITAQRQTFEMTRGCGVQARLI